MSDREQQRRAEQSRQDRARSYRGSFTIQEWCEYRRISRAMFYKMREQGIAPKTHNAGVKNLISAEADQEWLQAREAEHETVAA
jgi:hypothetical protein